MNKENRKINLVESNDIIEELEEKEEEEKDTKEDQEEDKKDEKKELDKKEQEKREKKKRGRPKKENEIEKKPRIEVEIKKKTDPRTIETRSKRIYVIEKILKHKSITGTRRYLVKWKGYEDKDNSWIDEKDILDPKLLENYLASL